MKILGSIREGLPEANELVSTWWRGKMPTNPVTWNHRNISSITANAVGDITLTFQLPFATIYGVMVGGEGTGTLAANVGSAALSAAVTRSSVRFITSNTSSAQVESQNGCVGLVGEF